MANYNESQISGTKWQRCKEIYLINEYNQVPSMIFNEEEIILIEGSTPIKKIINTNCVATFDPQAVINIINPLTGQFTGTQYTHQQLYEILYSLYIDTATKRDAHFAEVAAANAAYISSGGQVQQ